MPVDSSPAGQLKRVQGGVPFDSSLRLVSEFPMHPQDVLQRFPSMAQHDQAVKEWMKNLLISLLGPAQPNLTAKPGP